MGGDRVSKVATADVYPIVQVAIEGASRSIAGVVDMKVALAVAGGSTVLRVSYLAVVDATQVRANLDSWIETHRDVLRRRNVSVEVEEVEEWTLPSAEELQWLAYVSQAPTLPEEHFGPAIVMRALRKFNDGDVAAAAELFRQMIWHRESSSMRNNYAYCLLVLGEYSDAGRVLEGIPADAQTYMVRHNAAMQEVLSGAVQAGESRLEVLWKELQEEGNRDKLDAYSMLTLDAGLETVTSHAELPVDAAVIMNLVALGKLECTDGVLALEMRYPDRCGAWVRWLKEARLQNGTGAGDETGD